MMRVAELATRVRIGLREVTSRSIALPLLIYYPTSRCNSRCRSCDWWTRSGDDDLTLDEIAEVAHALPQLRTRAVAFSGGEPLLRPEVFAIARLFRDRGTKLQILTSGLLLERHAAEVAAHFGRVTVSLDASSEALYRAVRGVAALSAVEAGVARLQAVAPGLPIVARATLHKMNFRELPRLVQKAKAMRLDGISFLPADVSSAAFGRQSQRRPSELLLDRDEVDEFAAVIEQTIRAHADAFASGFIAERPDKLRRLPRYYAAMNGEGVFPTVSCNAPWVSAVVEANGAVRPCYFHRVVGNVRRSPLAEIVGAHLAEFRQGLDVSADPICRRCVCSIKVGGRLALRS